MTHRDRNRPSALSELAGGLGDAGLLIPLAVAMVALNGLNATAVFAGTGLTYCATALYFRVPVPVQPLKAFAAAAVALQLDAETIAAGALLMAAAMALLWATGLAAKLAERFPLVLVRGIQASVALLLAKAAYELAERGNWSGLETIDAGLGFAIALVACALLFAGRALRVPGSLFVLAAGAAAGFALSGWPDGVHAGPESLSLSAPSGAEFWTALTTLVIAQIPLTFGNSVVATVDAERSYFGAAAERVNAGRLSLSIAFANLGAGALQGLPVCHGAGGVTAHYKLGARTWRSTFMVGAGLVVLGIGLGSSAPVLLELLVPPALAGMLLYVAIQHGILAMQLQSAAERALAAGVGAVTLFSGNLAIGFAAGAAVLAGRALRRRRSSMTIHFGHGVRGEEAGR